uniref:Solute carrier family 40 protein n=1 Tax=Aureoumbra lagunensis TaxID=44058 RepID=A0A7S3ND88_9STRA
MTKLTELLLVGFLLGQVVALQSPLLCLRERRSHSLLQGYGRAARRRNLILVQADALSISSEGAEEGGAQLRYESSTEKSWLERNPLVVKSLTMGITYGLADLTAQAFGRIVCGDICPITARIRRTVALMLIGCLAVGPLLSVWFDFIEWLIPGKSPRAIASRTAIDQAFQVPVMISIIFTGTSIAEGHNLQYCFLKIQAKLLSTWRDCLGVWIPVQLINQGLVPLRFRVLFQVCFSYYFFL